MEKYKVLLNTIGKMYPKTRFTFNEHGIKFEKQFYIDELLEIFDRFNEACERKETSNETQTSNCNKHAVSFPLVICCDCNERMTEVRPGKYQCDNPDCIRNQ
jgi:hypothetical protein